MGPEWDSLAAPVAEQSDLDGDSSLQMLRVECTLAAPRHLQSSILHLRSVVGSTPHIAGPALEPKSLRDDKRTHQPDNQRPLRMAGVVEALSQATKWKSNHEKIHRQIQGGRVAVRVPQGVAAIPAGSESGRNGQAGETRQDILKVPRHARGPGHARDEDVAQRANAPAWTLRFIPFMDIHLLKDRERGRFSLFALFLQKQFLIFTHPQCAVHFPKRSGGGAGLWRVVAYHGPMA